MSGFWQPKQKQNNPRYRGWTIKDDQMAPISRKGELLSKKAEKIDVAPDPEPLDEEIT